MHLEIPYNMKVGIHDIKIFNVNKCLQKVLN